MEEEKNITGEEVKKSLPLNGKNKMIWVAIGILVIGGLYFYSQKPNSPLNKLFQKGITQDEAKAKVEKFITDNGGGAEVKSVSDENGLYKIMINANGQEIPTYVTKDGTKFFPQAVDFAEVQKKMDDAKKAAENKIKNAAKKDVPEVELFVMSYCPYGTQSEKGIIPVLATLGDKIKFNLRFVSYAMHEKKEIDENLRQFCIQKNEPSKLIKYLTCFLKKGEGTENACMAEAGVNAAKTSSCMSATDNEFKISASYKDKSKWSNGQYPPFDVEKDLNTKYGVQGSPTLVVNGGEVEAGRDASSLLKAICNGFETQPEECVATLSPNPPSPGFGEGVAAAGSAGADASCGN
jgi:hypothetical protein